MPQLKDPTPSPLRMPIADLLRRWPTLAQVFIAYRMACVGCDFSKFHTVEDAARIYPLQAEAFLEEITASIKASTAQE
jgi:hybrid cluster-associated redox disulfide protein